ncbi:MAG: YXWGXW repeat-containing protein [Candidatus Hydrogenedentes bacterium]|nr:YXWGXW repeat-containing protein [Candidatus Hydrogenedentota bacterium]
MKAYRLAWAIAVPAVGIWVAPLLMLGVATAAQGQATTEAGVQVLTRGPVHEAFAEASMTEATPGVIITKAPASPISELPPDQRPEGANVAWIPGYWSWDDDRTDFIWVSGVWRDIPPGRQWVPGYWTPVEGGSQWISGFWGDVAKTKVTYLPAPPEPLETGPSSPAPAPDHTWTPGCWVWQQTRYDWQPGHWVVQRPDWVWAPAHYTWTPRGYIYVQGYWDHDLVHRGVMFAPVYYEQPIYARPSYSYSPSVVIDLGVIAACLFIQPTSHHYYFGDYYDHRYEERGFYPWYSQHTRYGVDINYASYRSQQLLQDRDWDVHVDEQFRHRRDNVDARPPQTLALQANFINSRKAGGLENVVIGQSFAEATQNKMRHQRFTSLNVDERKQIETRGREIHKRQSDRARMETSSKAAGKSKGGHEPKAQAHRADTGKQHGKQGNASGTEDDKNKKGKKGKKGKKE